jgi:hypothetical protein
LLERNARLQPPDQSKGDVIAKPKLRFQEHRQRDVRPTAGQLAALEFPWRHADDGYGGFSYGDGPANDRGVPVEPTCPEAIADHRHRISPGCIVGRSEESPRNGANTQHVEVVAVHELAAAHFRFAIDGDTETARVVRDQACQRAALRAKTLECLRGEPVDGSALGLHVQEKDELVRIPGWQHAEERRVEQAEDGRVCADAQCHGQNGHERESRALDQSSESQAKVLTDAFDPGPDPDVSRILAGEGDVAERAAARVQRLGRRHSGALELLLSHRAMGLELLGQFGLELAMPEPVAESAKDPGHSCLPCRCPPERVCRDYPVCSTRWMAVTSRSNSSRSAPSCLRPAAVSV